MLRSITRLTIAVLLVFLAVGCGSLGRSAASPAGNKLDAAYQICRQLPDGDDQTIDRLVNAVRSARDRGNDGLEVLRVALNSCDQSCGGEDCTAVCNRCAAAVVDAVYNN